MKPAELINLKYSKKEIQKKTGQIFDITLFQSKYIKEPNFVSIAGEDLERLFYLYDSYFFNEHFTKNFKDKLNFRLSKRMTSAGGRTSSKKNSGIYEITLSTSLLFQTFEDVKRKITVNGIICNNRLEAAMKILEHEIIHLVEWTTFGKTSCKGKRFKNMSNNIFGHTDVTHQLVTQREVALKKMNLRVGDNVFFEFEGKRYFGEICNITKRATVMVRDKRGEFVDSRGKNYCKYYIPLRFLRKTNRGRKRRGKRK